MILIYFRVFLFRNYLQMNIFRLVHCVYRHSVYSTYSTRCEEVYAQDIAEEEKKTVLFCCPHKQPKLCPKNQLNNNKKRSRTFCYYRQQKPKLRHGFTKKLRTVLQLQSKGGKKDKRKQKKRILLNYLLYYIQCTMH